MTENFKQGLTEIASKMRVKDASILCEGTAAFVLRARDQIKMCNEENEAMAKEYDRRVKELQDRLDAICNRAPIMGSTGDYREGQLHALEACREAAKPHLCSRCGLTADRHSQPLYAGAPMKCPDGLGCDNARHIQTIGKQHETFEETLP